VSIHKRSTRFNTDDTKSKPRQQELHQRNIPFFKGFLEETVGGLFQQNKHETYGKYSVVGVEEYVGDNSPGIVPSEILLVN
jgi:hypothetical protein